MITSRTVPLLITSRTVPLFPSELPRMGIHGLQHSMELRMGLDQQAESAFYAEHNLVHEPSLLLAGHVRAVGMISHFNKAQNNLFIILLEKLRHKRDEIFPETCRNCFCWKQMAEFPLSVSC